jgi:hypothetical protein
LELAVPSRGADDALAALTLSGVATTGRLKWADSFLRRQAQFRALPPQLWQYSGLRAGRTSVGRVQDYRVPPIRELN